MRRPPVGNLGELVGTIGARILKCTMTLVVDLNTGHFCGTRAVVGHRKATDSAERLRYPTRAFQASAWLPRI